VKLLRITTLTLASIGCTTVAQDVPPLPPLRGDAANLKDTMKFIENKLPGVVQYAVYMHDNTSGKDGTVFRMVQLTNVTADPGRCSIKGHMFYDSGGGAKAEHTDFEVILKRVETVTFQQMDQILQQRFAKGGRPQVSVRVEPAIFVVVLGLESELRAEFTFYEDTLADRVSKAMDHAVQLCDGGNKEPF
jgi:hypothetical protein